MVGTLGAVVDFSVLNLLTSQFSVPSVIASIVSFVAAVISNFYLNRKWTFPDSRSKKVSRQILQFLVVSLAGLAIRVPIFSFLETTFFGLFSTTNIALPFQPQVIAQNVALIIVILIIGLWNFTINRLWTYSDVD